MRYNKIYYWSPMDNAYVVSVPSLPGCMSDGATVDIALKNTNIIIQDWIEVANELRRPIPPEDPQVLELSDARITDVASYILYRLGKTTTWQLEKLVYYIYSWCLGLYFHPISDACFEDWTNGPVCRELYGTHRGKYYTVKNDYPLNHDFSATEKGFMDSILEVYGDKSPDWLKRQTHMEDPWKKTRGNLPSGKDDNKVIRNELIMAYYHN